MRFHEYKTMEQARAEAHEYALNGSTTSLLGTHYKQGGRDFVQLVIPIKKLLELTVQPERHKRGQQKPDPATTRNRPLDPPHVNEIVTYLRRNDTYLLPPIIVNSAQEMDIFLQESQQPTRPCVLVLPDAEALFITDGQHRVEALREASDDKAALRQDAIGVTLIEETDLDRIHQDFYDAAQTKKLEPSLLVGYDSRSMGNALARDISQSVLLFKERTERFSNTIGKNSIQLFSMNQIKQACFFLVLGVTTAKASTILERVNQKIVPAYDAYVDCLRTFFERMSLLNPQWHQIVESPLAAAKVVDPVPKLRDEYLHCVAGGLNVISCVGHSILLMQETITADFTPEQEEMLTRLAMLDWRRDSGMWKGGIVSTSGSVTPHRGNLQLAIALAKEHVHLPLSTAESNALERFRTPDKARELVAAAVEA